MDITALPTADGSRRGGARAGLRCHCFDDTEGGLLPVAEVCCRSLHWSRARRRSPCARVAGRPMTDFQEQFRVVELWQPQKAWMLGAEQERLLTYAGPTPDPKDKQGGAG